MDNNFNDLYNLHDNLNDDSEEKLNNLGSVMQEMNNDSKPNIDLSKFKPSQRMLPHLMLTLIEHNIGCKFDLLSGSYFIEGFYKNGDLELQEDEHGKFIAVDKKGNQLPVDDFDSLVLLNFEFWKLSGGKNGNYSPLVKPWLDHLIERGLVKRQVTYAPFE